jgi:hypothetical protein
MMKNEKNKMMTGVEKSAKQKFYFPHLDKVVEADSQEEAEEKVKEGEKE